MRPSYPSIHCLQASKAESCESTWEQDYTKYAFIVITFSLTSKFWCRNRPGDEMKDKYNQFSNSLLAFSDEVVDMGEQLYCIGVLLGYVTEEVGHSYGVATTSVLSKGQELQIRAQEVLYVCSHDGWISWVSDKAENMWQSRVEIEGYLHISIASLPLKRRIAELLVRAGLICASYIH